MTSLERAARILRIVVELDQGRDGEECDTLCLLASMSGEKNRRYGYGFIRDACKEPMDLVWAAYLGAAEEQALNLEVSGWDVVREIGKCHTDQMGSDRYGAWRYEGERVFSNTSPYYPTVPLFPRGVCVVRDG